MDKVKVNKIDYMGWNNAIEITNGLVEVVVVPGIGRIMAYRFCGEKNILWHDSALEGKHISEAVLNQKERLEWANFGGDKVWPTEQSLFPVLNGFAWPPDPYMDALGHQVQLFEDGVQIMSPVSPFCGAQIVRRIRLSPGETHVHIDQILTKVKLANQVSEEPIPLTIWNITQIPVPDLVVFPVASKSQHNNGVAIWEIDNRISENLSIDNAIGTLTPAENFDQKVGTDAGNWLAAIIDDVAIVETFNKIPEAIYPDSNCTTEIYSCPNYVELELLSPVQRLHPGESISYPIFWNLKKVSGSLEQKKQEVLHWVAC